MKSELIMKNSNTKKRIIKNNTKNIKEQNQLFGTLTKKRLAKRWHNAGKMLGKQNAW